MILCFVSVRSHNWFMTELLSAIATAVADAGQQVELAFDAFPSGREYTYVVIPHEFSAYPGLTEPTDEQRRRTVALCTENPGTPWFETASRLFERFGATIAINRYSQHELGRRGIQCEYFQLGYSRLWDAWQGRPSERPIDILYLGAEDERRDPIIAAHGRHLWARRCELLVPRLHRRGAPAVNNLIGADKHRRLAGSRILLNLHRTSSSSLEWVRYLEAACNGCVTLSEPSTDHAPLVPGEHFVTASARAMPLIADRLLDDPERLDRIRATAYDFIRAELSMERSAQRLIALAAQISASCGGERRSTAALAPSLQLPSPEPDPPAHREPQNRAASVRGQLYDVARIPRSGLRRVALDRSLQRITVVVVVRDAAAHVDECLASVAAMDGAPFELLVLDDSDNGCDSAADFLENHPWLGARMSRPEVRRGVARGRNELLAAARGEYVLVLDSRDHPYPSLLTRLTEALDDDPEASLAYPMAASCRDGQPIALIGALPWDPDAVREGETTASISLLRRDHALAVGGYPIEPHAVEADDLGLWQALAAHGRCGVQVPQVLASTERLSAASAVRRAEGVPLGGSA